MEPLSTGDRGGEFRPMSDLIPKLKPASMLSDEDLLVGQHYAKSAAALQAELDTALEVLGEVEKPDGVGERTGLNRVQRGTMRDNVPRLRRAIEVAVVREQRARERNRPEGCWCLGLGGRGTMGRALGDSIDVRAGQTWHSIEAIATDSASGRALERAETYCTCPEGIDRREREARRRTDWLSGFNVGREQERIVALHAKSGLPPLNEIYALEQYPQNTDAQRHTVAALKSWRPPRWLYLDGDMRRGKTTLAQALGLKALQRGYEVRYYRVSSLLDHLRAGFDLGQSQESLMMELQRVPFLILDDIGASNPTDFALDRLFVLLDERLATQRTTILTGNPNLGSGPDGLVSALAGPSTPDRPAPIQRYTYAQRIVARIKQAADVLEVKGPPLGKPAVEHEPLDW